ncbi:MAG: hypothetical protein WCK98_06250 [bacterium]
MNLFSETSSVSGSGLSTNSAGTTKFFSGEITGLDQINGATVIRTKEGTFELLIGVDGIRRWIQVMD